MTTVSISSNTFVDCTTLIGIRGRPLLRVEVDPLRVSLTTPPDIPSRRLVQVLDNTRQAGSANNVRVIATDKSVAIFWDTHPLVIATLIESQTVNLKLDLRAIGVNLYEDGNTLHVAGSELTGNMITGGGTAIGLG